ncbi:hypothetical protein IG631_11681 [Alternaria alternata]|jgi:hypothetical protein|nr:hypothetical protein IG631_11681 [Alternaria alternata]
MTCTIPVELQHSYRKSNIYPENLIPSDAFTNKSKLASYKKRLDAVEHDLCLVYGQDDVDNDFDIPVIDLGTADGKGIITITIVKEVLNHSQYARSDTYIHQQK